VRFGKLADCKQFAHSGQYTCVDVLTSLEGNKRFRTWVEKELDGYDQTDELPEYRRVRAIAKGHFLGGFSAQINNQRLPAFVLNAQPP
jgi:hypothetical protein